MPHSKTPPTMLTMQEVADSFNLPLHTVRWWFYNKRSTFCDKHVVMEKVGGKGKKQYIFTPLGVKRLEFLCKKAIANAAKANPRLNTTFSGKDERALNEKEETPKYNGIEKISRPKTPGLTLEDFSSEHKKVVEENASHDDAVLDIAVKIIAERQAFNKIKEEITALREDNAILAERVKKQDEMLGLVSAALYGWRV